MKNAVEVVGPVTSIYMKRKRDGLHLKTVIDTSDLAFVLDVIGGGTWSILNNREGSYYAFAHIKGQTVCLHRAIMECPRGLEVDHINRNGLDNRRENLRIVTRLGNIANQGPMSPYGKGYGYDAMMGKWRARVRCKGFSKALYFATEQEAIEGLASLRQEYYQLFPARDNSAFVVR
jgi:hypothetical protein